MQIFALPLFALCVAALPHTTRQTNSTAEGLAQTTAIVEATNALLALLSEDQQAELLHPYDKTATAQAVGVPGTGPVANRTFLAEGFGESLWTNYPYGYVNRPGLKLENLTEAQNEAVLDVLRVTLSEDGFNKIHDIRAADAYLGVVSAAKQPLVGYSAGLGEYALGIFGEPSLTDIWMIQFGGHHIGLNIALYQDQAVLAPAHTAIWPNIFVENNVTRRGLAAENDLAFDLYATLDDTLRAQATINHTVTELIQGPGLLDTSAPAEGVSVALFDSSQQDILFDIVSEWAGILNDVHAAPRLAEIRAGLSETLFAWSGPATHEEGKNGESYYRIEGPNLYVEYSPQYLMGYDGLGDGFQGLTTHFHAVYRDPLRAYGLSLVA